MSAPTLWEEGHLPGTRIVWLTVLAGVLVIGLDLLVGPQLSWVFDIGFVLLCVAAALGVRPSDFFTVAVLPPLLLLGLVVFSAAFETGWVARPEDNVVQAVISGLAHRAGGLVTAYALVLGVLAIRMRVRARHGERYSNRAGSPAPTRVTSG